MNPITPHGAVIVNASYDFTQYTKATSHGPRDRLWAGDTADHRIEKKDMVFRHKESHKRKRTSYNDPDLHVFGVCNGLEGGTAKEARKKCAFIGVSNTHLDAGSHRHASLTIAGMTTITNTGSERIEPGEKLVWDVADVNGPKMRQPFKTVPYDQACKATWDEIMTGVVKILGDSRAELPIKQHDRDHEHAPSVSNERVLAEAFSALMRAAGVTDRKQLLSAWQSKEMTYFSDVVNGVTRELDGRVIGTALSKAEPGNPFDILLRHAH